MGGTDAIGAKGQCRRPSRDSHAELAEFERSTSNGWNNSLFGISGVAECVPVFGRRTTLERADSTTL